MVFAVVGREGVRLRGVLVRERRHLRGEQGVNRRSNEVTRELVVQPLCDTWA